MIPISCKDDVPEIQDPKAGLIGAALGALGGGALGSQQVQQVH